MWPSSAAFVRGAKGGDGQSQRYSLSLSRRGFQQEREDSAINIESGRARNIVIWWWTRVEELIDVDVRPRDLMLLASLRAQAAQIPPLLHAGDTTSAHPTRLTFRPGERPSPSDAPLPTMAIKYRPVPGAAALTGPDT
jgi:hypothetical protein